MLLQVWWRARRVTADGQSPEMRFRIVCFSQYRRDTGHHEEMFTYANAALGTYLKGRRVLRIR